MRFGWRIGVGLLHAAIWGKPNLLRCPWSLLRIAWYATRCILSLSSNACTNFFLLTCPEFPQVLNEELRMRFSFVDVLDSRDYISNTIVTSFLICIHVLDIHLTKAKVIKSFGIWRLGLDSTIKTCFRLPNTCCHMYSCISSPYSQWFR